MKLRRISFFALLSIAISSLVPLNGAKAADPSVFGVVNSMTGAAISGVVIDALQNGNVIASTRTDANGSYALNLAEGTYELRYTPATSDYTALQSLPIDLPQNWPLNVILSTPSVGKSFLKGFIGVDGGAAAVEPENQASAFCSNGGNYTDANGYFSLSVTSGTSCTLGFQGFQRFSPTERLGFYLSKGPSVAVNQDTYLDVIVPITSTTVKVVDSTGKQLTPADGLTSVRLEVGGQMDYQMTKMVGDQATTYRGQKVFSEGKVSVFTGLQDFSTTWQSSATPIANGLATIKRPAMTSGIQGTVTIITNGVKFLNSETKEVTIDATGGAITVVASLKNLVTMSGKVTYSDGSALSGAYVSSGVTGVNTGSNTATDGTYKASFPSGSVSGGMDLTRPTITYPNGNTFSWEYYLKYKGQIISSNLTQDFTVPLPTTQQVKVIDGNGNIMPNATVQIGRYYTSENQNRGDIAAVLAPNLPKARLNWNGTAKTDANGIATVPAMPMSTPQQMWITAAPALPSVWSPLNKLMTVGNGLITIQLESRTWKVTGSVKSSENFPIITPTVMALTATGGGGNYADANGNYSITVKDNVPFSYSITSRRNDIVNPDTLMFNLSQKSGAVTPKSDISQNFVLPVNYQKVKVVDPAGDPIVGTKVVLRVAADEKSPATIVIDPNLPAFVGSFTGYSTTGIDGFAAVPGLVNNQMLAATLFVTPDVNSRYLPKSANIQVGDRKDIVVVLAIKPPTVTSVSPSSARVGETIVVRGTGFMGATAVNIGDVSANYTVVSATQINVFPPLNSTGGAITVSNGAGSSTFGNVIITQSPLSISTASLPGATQNLAYQIQLSAIGGTSPYKWTRVALGLPNGLTISESGIISGNPLQAGTWRFTLGVTDGSGATVTRNYSISVAADPKFIPGTPVNLKVSQAGGRINVSWDATISDNGNPITGYIVQTSTTGTSWSTVVSNTKSPTPSTSFSVRPGTYYVRVAAVNASGTGAFSAASLPVLVASAPSTPGNVTIALNGTTITTNWSIPANNGSPISGYRIRYSQDGINWITLVSDTKSTSTTYNFTSPVKGKVYVQVAAINAIDLGRYTSSNSFVTVL